MTERYFLIADESEPARVAMGEHVGFRGFAPLYATTYNVALEVLKEHSIGGAYVSATLPAAPEPSLPVRAGAAGIDRAEHMPGLRAAYALAEARVPFVITLAREPDVQWRAVLAAAQDEHWKTATARKGDKTALAYLDRAFGELGL